MPRQPVCPPLQNRHITDYGEVGLHNDYNGANPFTMASHCFSSGIQVTGKELLESSKTEGFLLCTFLHAQRCYG